MSPVQHSLRQLVDTLAFSLLWRIDPNFEYRQRAQLASLHTAARSPPCRAFRCYDFPAFPASLFSRDSDFLFFFIFWISGFLAALVFEFLAFLLSLVL